MLLADSVDEGAVQLRSLLPACAAALCLATTGCYTVETKRPIAATAEMRVGLPARAWEVVSGESELVGLVILFESPRPMESHYMVRNVWHQDLGLIDSLGRSYRYLPHHREPAWVGSGTIVRGVERILDSGDCQLVEVPFRETRHATSPGELEQRRADRAGSDDSEL